MRKYKTAQCSYCGEEKPIAAKGLCRACYQRKQKTGSLEYQRKGKRSVCDVHGCNDYVVSHGLCDKHRTRLKRYGQTESLRPGDWGSRECHPLYRYWSDTKRRSTLNLCDEWRLDFWAFVSCVKQRPSSDHYIRAVDLEKDLGPDNWQWVLGLTDANRKIATREKANRYEKKRLRVSTEERLKLLSAADGRCQICGAESNDTDCPTTGSVKTSSLCVDHCHETGELRGILCRACNSGLGHFKDDISLLEKAIVYLRGNRDT